MAENEDSVKIRKEKVKMMREERRQTTPDDDFELIDVSGSSSSSYTSLVARNVMAMDLSRHSTYTQLGIGGATGWFTGYMVGKVGKALAAAVGGSILLINMGTRAGYITVDWDKVDTDMKTASEQVSEKIAEQQDNDETKQLMERGAVFVQRNLVMVGGFAAGFFLGMAS